MAVSKSKTSSKSPEPDQVSDRFTGIPERRHAREVAQAQKSMTRAAVVHVVLPSTSQPEENKDAVQDAEPPESYKAA